MKPGEVAPFMGVASGVGTGTAERAVAVRHLVLGLLAPIVARAQQLGLPLEGNGGAEIYGVEPEVAEAAATGLVVRVPGVDRAVWRVRSVMGPCPMRGAPRVMLRVEFVKRETKEVSDHGGAPSA